MPHLPRRADSALTLATLSFSCAHMVLLLLVNQGPNVVGRRAA